MKNIFTAILFLSFAFGFAQNEPTDVMKGAKTVEDLETSKKDFNQIFTVVDVSAQPAFGMNSFRQYIARSFRLPEVDTTTMGRVVTKFSVCEDGSICDIQIVAESPQGLGLGKEAIRIINSYGSWKPATLDDKAVSSYYTLPIVLQITGFDDPAPTNKERKD